MSLPVVYLPQAEDDVADVHAAYEQQRAGLGDQFLEALRTQIDRIQSNPYLFGIIEGEVRATPLRRFPYVVFYRIHSADVLIIAVLHGKRSSLHWRNRI